MISTVSLVSIPVIPWRLIFSEFADGPLNMAVDEAILDALAEGRVPPTLRFYGWRPPCLSLGYAQPISDVDFERLRERGWGLVRRPTGGRAILHTDELTYSVVAPMREPHVAGGVLESYRRLSSGLLRGLQLLGVPAEAAADPPRPEGLSETEWAAVCFEVPSHYEITAAGKKLLGSAQVRKRGVVLQHGSLPLSGNIARICDGLRFASEAERETAKARVRARAITVAEALDGTADCFAKQPRMDWSGGSTVGAPSGRDITWHHAAQAIAQGFRDALDLEFVEGELTEGEWARAAELKRERYASGEWNKRA